MSFRQSFMLAIKSIMASKVRAFLTMLGIIIGVAAVIIILSLGNGMTAMMTDSFASMGTNLINVTLTGRGSSRSITAEELYELAQDNRDSILAVSPTVGVRASLKYGNETLSSTSVTGVSEDYGIIRKLEVDKGRFIQYIDVLRRQNVCVVGSYLEKTYFPQGAIGNVLKINGYEYTVVGVLAEDAESEEGSGDDAVFIPYTNGAKLSTMGEPVSYSFSAVSEDTVLKAKNAIQNRLYKAYGDSDAYNILSMTELLKELSTLTGTFVAVLSAIAGISLLVGGIGIMNIMLVSVTERTREIGIRKSVGAKRRDIMAQFVIEAATTSLMGGAVGIGLGAIGAVAAGNLVGMTATPSVSAIVLAAGVSLAIGVLFGFLPANKAAKLNPIDALRYD